MAAECDHGEPYGPGWACPPCQTTPRRTVDITHGPIFAARYDGRCVTCDQTIDAGDLVQALAVDGDHAGYVHTRCADR